MYEGEKSLRSIFADTMLEVGVSDPDLVVLVGDISHFILQPFAKACPGRYYNVGICEQTIVSMASGLAHTGFKPVVHTISPFIIERAFEQIKLDFCYQELGGNLITVGGAFDYTTLGCSHYCYGDFALIKSLPKSQIVYPAMPNEFKKLFKLTYSNDKLTYFRLPGKRHEVVIEDEKIVFGKATLIEPGKDITVIATGPQLKTAVDSLTEFAKLGLDVEIIYIHTIKPFDYALVSESVRKTRKYLVIEEHSQFGGVGDEVMRATQNIENVKSAFLSIPDNFEHGYGNYKDHCEQIGLTSENLIHHVKRLCS